MRLAGFYLFAALVTLLPVLFPDNYFVIVIGASAGLHVILAVGLNLLMGYAGQISLGHAAFFGLGAYGSGILSTTYEWNPWLAMTVVALVVGGLAFTIGFPILKLKGHYLAMATLGMGIIVYIVFNEWIDMTEGPSGFSGIPNLELGPLVFDSDIKNYYLVWSFVLGCVLLSVNLANSRIGRAFRAIHDAEVAARVMGVNARLLKVQVFALSAMICAIAGSLYAHVMTFIAPPSFGFNISVELLTMVVIGGLGSIYGSFLGALLLTMLPEFLRFMHDYDIVFYGGLLMIMTIFMPGGLVRGIPDLFRKITGLKNKKGGAHA